jgi:hypothetical protein
VSQLWINRGKHSGRLLLVIAQLFGCVLIFGVVVAAGQQADELLKKGYFYYNNDDITDKAATQFRAVMAKYPKSDEAETAQYYLGSYFQRKYYVELTKYRRTDPNALKSAKDAYRAYTNKYYKSGNHQWLADAFFNLALVFLQQGDAKNAGYELNKMGGAASLDGSVYIYQVIYSQNKDDVLNSEFRTKALADYASSIVGNSNQSFAQKVAAIKQWCRNQGAKQAS